MSLKPSKSEVEYFAQEEVEKRHKLHELHKREAVAHEREERKHLHHMKCSKCGGDLRKTKIVGLVNVDECAECGALVVTKDELRKIKEADNSLLKSLAEFFTE